MDLEANDTVELYLGVMNCSDSHRFLEASEADCNFKALEIGSKVGDAILLFRGSLGNLIGKFRFAGGVISVLAVLFAGLFITSNLVEIYFSSKSIIARHRSTRGRARILRCLVNYYNLRHSSNVTRLYLTGGSRPPDLPYLLAL